MDAEILVKSCIPVALGYYTVFSLEIIYGVPSVKDYNKENHLSFVKRKLTEGGEGVISRLTRAASELFSFCDSWP